MLLKAQAQPQAGYALRQNGGQLCRFRSHCISKVVGQALCQQDLAVTVTIPPEIRTAFLIGKCIEELLEAREAEGLEDKKAELADILEVVRGLINAAQFELLDVVSIADKKREKLGGFDTGSVLIETSLPTSQTNEMSSENLGVPVRLVKQLDEDTYEVPFNFFGFAQLGYQWHSISKN